MTYSINGVPLQNENYGWRLLRRSQPLTPVTLNLAALAIPGRDGVLGGVPSYKAPPLVTLVVRTEGSGVEPLYKTLLKNGGTGLFSITDDSSRVAVFELASISPNGLSANDELVDVSFTIRFPSADWRETSLTTENPTVSSGVTDAGVFEGISAPITDAGIFIAGDFGNFELIDGGSGSWLRSVKTVPYVAGTGLLYVGGTGQAFRATTAAPWTPTTDLSDYVDVSGGGGFRITPTWDTDPEDTVAKLKLTVTESSGVTFQIRAANAYALQGVAA